MIFRSSLSPSRWMGIDRRGGKPVPGIEEAWICRGRLWERIRGFILKLTKNSTWYASHNAIFWWNADRRKRRSPFPPPPDLSADAIDSFSPALDPLSSFSSSIHIFDKLWFFLDTSSYHLSYMRDIHLFLERERVGEEGENREIGRNLQIFFEVIRGLYTPLLFLFLSIFFFRRIESCNVAFSFPPTSIAKITLSRFIFLLPFLFRSVSASEQSGAKHISEHSGTYYRAALVR